MVKNLRLCENLAVETKGLFVWQMVVCLLSWVWQDYPQL
jgi:hypothetical protein